MPKPTELSNQPSDDQVRTYVNGMIELIVEREELNAKIGGFRKLAKLQGIELKRADNIIKMLDWEPDEIKAAFAADRRYAELMGLPVGTQLDLFDGSADTAADVKEKMKWRARGRMLGLAGKGDASEAPEGCPPECYQAFGEGLEDGQDETQQAFLRIQGEKEGKVTPIKKGAKGRPEKAEDPLLN
jgi:hypothetical protein